MSSAATSKSGTTVRFPENLQFRDRSDIVASDGLETILRRRAAGRKDATLPDEDELNASLILGVVEQPSTGTGRGVRLADAFELVPIQSASRPGRRAPSTQTDGVTIEVPLAKDENAAVLLERDGVFEWQMPSVLPYAKNRRAAGAPKVAVFQLDEGQARLRRGVIGWTTDMLLEPVRAYVIKWVSKKVVGTAAKFLERNVTPGMIAISSDDPNSWTVSNPKKVKLPSDRPARLLIMIHGTFSSTLGSFGALGLIQSGKTFLGSAIAGYDAVLAFDHKTLSVDPEANAKDIVAALSRVSIPAGSTADIIAFSRGGLIARELSERALDAADIQLAVKRVVFVGATNGGTALAEPKNWKSLLDLYTNLAVAAGRGLSVLDAGLASTILTESAKTLGSFVEAIVETAITESKVPGLAAMSPSGFFVSRLNRSSPQPVSGAEAEYFAIGSDFEATVDPGVPSQLPARLVRAIADFGVDSLMNEANDLVVDNEAMTEFGPYRTWLRDQRMWGANGTVFHTNYFAQPEVVRALSGWLLEPDAAKPQIPKVLADLPTSVAIQDIVELPADTPIVIERPAYGHYVRTAGQILDRISDVDHGLSLLLALDLREDQVAERIQPGKSPPSKIGVNGWVMLAADGTVAEALPPIAVANALPLPIDARRRGVGHDLWEDVFDVDSKPPSRRASHKPGTDDTAPVAAPPTIAPEVQCHFSAEMQDHVPAAMETDVTVTISRENLNKTATATVQTASAPTRLEEPIDIEVVAKANCEIVDAYARNIRVPDLGSPEVYVFPVKGKAPGPAELWVDVRQGKRRLTRMVLQPTFTAAQKNLRAVAVAAADRPEKAVVELRIVEEVASGDMYRLRFIMSSPDLKVGALNKVSEVGRSKDDFVADVYDRLEGDWGRTAGEFVDFVDTLRIYGAYLYEQIFPATIQEALWKYRDQIGCVQVFSEEPSIPWEMLYVIDPVNKDLEGGCFLGELGLVRWIDNQHWPPSLVRARKGRCFHVIPDYADPKLVLKGATEEAKVLGRLFESKAVKGNKADVVMRLRDGGQIDLLHFACHGSANTSKIWQAALLLSGSKRADGTYFEEELSVGDVQFKANFRGVDGERPIVFINACQAGVAGRTLTGIGGMAQAFISKGAGIFVSTLWSIGDKVAQGFCETFYGELQEGKTVTEAARAARESARKASEPTWLAYTIYGHPYARLEKADV